MARGPGVVPSEGAGIFPRGNSRRLTRTRGVMVCVEIDSPIVGTAACPIRHELPLARYHASRWSSAGTAKARFTPARRVEKRTLRRRFGHGEGLVAESGTT